MSLWAWSCLRIGSSIWEEGFRGHALMIGSPGREIRSLPLASLGSELSVRVRFELLRGWSCREEAPSLGEPMMPPEKCSL